MLGIDGLREHLQRMGMERLGVSPSVNRVLAGQVRQIGQEAALLRLPLVTAGRHALTNEDGDPYFIVGISDPNGDDVF